MSHKKLYRENMGTVLGREMLLLIFECLILDTLLKE
jgi:hypothetical protein